MKGLKKLHSGLGGSSSMANQGRCFQAVGQAATSATPKLQCDTVGKRCVPLDAELLKGGQSTGRKAA